jgi:hydrogenase maturation protein HypF
VLEWRGDHTRSDTHGHQALEAALGALRAGRIVAIKGLGGYHLACDATDSAAVERLRARKHRDAKPFAIMARDLESAHQVVLLSRAEAELLQTPERPILLAAKRPSAEGIAAAVAPGTRYLGVMLPYTPLHHLLLAQVDRPLVMTSGNRTDEPIAFRDADALASLSAIADGFLLHNRPIQTRCDDSVLRVAPGPSGGTRFMRRSRGFAPRPLRLRERWRVPVLAVGGHLKNTFCLAKDAYAFLSHHIGDLENPAAYRALQDGIAHYCRLFDVAPAIIAHDQHPDYLSTRLAETLEGERIAVQHHHAHVASCMAEHDVTEPVIGVVFDGAGLGADGAVWGGEFLLAEDAHYERVAHLSYVPLPGGDGAAREPWRMGVAHLWAAYGDEMERVAPRFFEALDPAALGLLRQMLRQGVHAPPTSSVGRLFDAVAALLGVCVQSQYEAQAAIQLEAMVASEARGSYPFDMREVGAGWEIEAAPVIRAIVADITAGRPKSEIAGAFHQAMSDMVVETTDHVSRQSGVRRVALTGGVFQNAILEERTVEALVRRGYQVLVQRRVPCNDGGLSLGQAVIAARSALCA